MGYVAGLDTVERTAFGLFQPLFHPLQEGVVDGPARHTHRTLDDLYVLLRGFDVTPLELRRGVALLRSDEARPHLNAVGAQLHDAINVFARVDAACCDDRDVRIVRRAETTDFRNDFGQQPLQREVFVGDLFRLVAQVPAGLGSLDHDRVGNVFVVGEPFLADEFGGSGRRNDRSQLRLAAFGQERRQVEGHTGPRKDDVGLLCDGRSDHVCEVGHGYHDIDADDAFGLFTGFAQLFAQAPDACRIVVLGVFPVDDAQSGRGDHSHTALVGYGRCESREGDAYAHTALNDGKTGQQIADFQCFHS